MQLGSKRALLGVTGIYKTDSIESILHQNLDVNALKRTLLVTATNLSFATADVFYEFVGEGANERQAAFQKARGADPAFALSRDNFVQAVRASAAIPAAFEPVPMNLGVASAKAYVDGGVANNTPMSMALDAGATEALVVLLQPEQITQQVYPTTNLREIVISALTLMSQTNSGNGYESRGQSPGCTDSLRPSTLSTSSGCARFRQTQSVGACVRRRYRGRH